MVGRPFPSGSAEADRRASYAETMAHLGDLGAAIEVLSGAMTLVPDWAAGWFRLGEYFEMVGEVQAAAEAWARAEKADPADPLGAGLRKALVQPHPLVETMPPAFVELLFDQYAPRFERSLVDKLAYRGPEMLLDALKDSGFQRADRALDLGCGTGLMGEELRPHCAYLEGLDLSANMLAEAAAKGLYDSLSKRDIATLQLGSDRYDLIVAADVFIYLGALERVVAWCAGSLAPGGRLAFTVELGEAPVMLRPSRRFAHSRAYVAGLMRDAGFASVMVREGVLRQDKGADILALVVVASDVSRPDAATGQDEAGVLA